MWLKAVLLSGSGLFHYLAQGCSIIWLRAVYYLAQGCSIIWLKAVLLSGLGLLHHAHNWRGKTIKITGTGGAVGAQIGHINKVARGTVNWQ
jgi:hypothetical protein